MGAQGLRSQERFYHANGWECSAVVRPFCYRSSETYALSILGQKGTKATRTLMCHPVPAHLQRFLCKMKGFSWGYICLLWQRNRHACGEEGKDPISVHTQAWAALNFQVKSKYSHKVFCHWYWHVFTQSDITGRQMHLCTSLWYTQYPFLYFFLLFCLPNNKKYLSIPFYLAC